MKRRPQEQRHRPTAQPSIHLVKLLRSPGFVVTSSLLEWRTPAHSSELDPRADWTAGPCRWGWCPMASPSGTHLEQYDDSRAAQARNQSPRSRSCRGPSKTVRPAAGPTYLVGDVLTGIPPKASHVLCGRRRYREAARQMRLTPILAPTARQAKWFRLLLPWSRVQSAEAQ